MTKDELIEALRRLRDDEAWDPERQHYDADELILQYINDPDIRLAYERVPKWYA